MSRDARVLPMHGYARAAEMPMIHDGFMHTRAVARQYGIVQHARSCCTQ